MSKTKSLITFARCLGDYYKKSFSGYRETAKKFNWWHFFSLLISNLLICIAFALFCSLKEGTGDLYMNVFIPVFFANTIIILYSYVNNSTDLFALLTVFLTTAGTALQIFMLPASNEDSLQEVKKYVFILFFGIIASIIIIPSVMFLFSKNIMIDVIIGLMFVVTIVTYLILLLFGKEANGTKAWINIGNNSFQLTEVSKLTALITIPVIIQDKKHSEKAKSLLSTILLSTHSIFLIMLNELGTLCIILLVSFLIRIIFVSQKKYIVQEIAVFLLLAAVAFAGCFGIYKLNATAVQPVDSLQEQEAENISEIDSVITAIDNHSLALNAETSMSDEKVGPSALDRVISRVARIYPKIVQRLKVFLKSEDVSAEDMYQINRAEEALLGVSWFGTPRGSLSMVPEIDSDFVFIYLIVRLGIIGVILVFAALIAMLIEVVVKGSLSQGKGNLYIIAVAFILSITFQSLLCSCSNIGLFPIIGLPFPYLSHGGAALCANLFMAMFIMSFLGNNSRKEITGNVKGQ